MEKRITMSRRKQMGDLLVEAGVLKKANLAEALNKQKLSKKPLGEILQGMGVIREQDIALVLATQFNIQSASKLTEKVLPRELLNFVDLDTAIKKMVCPISREGSRLNLAMANPLDLKTIDDINFRTELEVVPWVSTPSEILAAIRLHYLGTTATSSHELCKILIVEDKAKVRNAVVDALQEEGYRLFKADDAEEGLHAVLRHSPHLIITETVMPGMDGCEMFKVLQNSPDTRCLPVVGFSSKASKEEEIRLLNMGFADFLPKPLNLDLMKARISRVLDLVYPDQNFAIVPKGKNQDSSSLYEAIHTLLDLLQATLDREETKK